MLVSKDRLEQAKANEDQEFFASALHPSANKKDLLFVLNNLGKLPPHFDSSLFPPLLYHMDDDIRLAAAKNLGKTKDSSHVCAVTAAVSREPNTQVRREMVSAIGRMRTKEALPSLCALLQDEDPKVVLQAIRALLCFRNEDEIIQTLLSLADHPNELVRAAINREIGAERTLRPSRNDHARSPDWLKNLIVQGDAHTILRLIPDESVHLTFTSPPYYNARDYTLYSSYEAYLSFLCEIFREVHRVTKEGRFFVLNSSPILIPRMSRKHSSARYLIPFDIHPRILDLGFEFIEDIIWLKPDPSAKNRNGGFFQHRKPLGYKANSVCEYVMVYRKKTDRLIDWNMRQYEESVMESSKVQGDYEKTNVWKIAPNADSVHSAVFPKELAARVIQFYSYKGDLVLDPFAGSGTVGRAAMELERRFLLTEIEESYASHAFQSLCKGNLFAEAPRLAGYDDFVKLSEDAIGS